MNQLLPTRAPAVPHDARPITGERELDLPGADRPTENGPPHGTANWQDADRRDGRQGGRE
jgi:hypothetical protein